MPIKQGVCQTWSGLALVAHPLPNTIDGDHKGVPPTMAGARGGWHGSRNEEMR